jgi:hypothetical protein
MHGPPIPAQTGQGRWHSTPGVLACYSNTYARKTVSDEEILSGKLRGLASGGMRIAISIGLKGLFGGMHRETIV